MRVCEPLAWHAENAAGLVAPLRPLSVDNEPYYEMTGAPAVWLSFVLLVSMHKVRQIAWLLGRSLQMCLPVAATCGRLLNCVCVCA